MATPNMLDPKTFERNPLFIRPGETSEQYTTRVNSPKAPAQPLAPAPRDYGKTARTAGGAGLGVSDYRSLLGATPDEEQAAKDEIAKQMGYDDSSKLLEEVFAKPSKTTEQFYNQAYSAAGLEKLLSGITAKRTSLNKAVGAINDNPWLTEASRSGKARNLQQLATADISAYEQEYALKHDRVKQLVSQYMTDLGQDEKVRDARFKYLESTAKTKAEAAAIARANDFLGDYLEGKKAAEPADAPKTVSVGEGQALYQWNPVTQDFELIVKRPKTYAPKSSAAGSSTSGNKVLDQFQTDLTKINPKTETREALLARLTAKYGSKIDPQDIARKVMETYPNGWETRYRISTPQADPLDKYNQ